MARSGEGHDGILGPGWSRAHLAVEHEDLPGLAQLLSDGRMFRTPMPEDSPCYITRST